MEDGHFATGFIGFEVKDINSPESMIAPNALIAAFPIPIELRLLLQLSILVGLVMLLEFICMLLELGTCFSLFSSSLKCKLSSV